MAGPARVLESDTAEPFWLVVMTANTVPFMLSGIVMLALVEPWGRLTVVMPRPEKNATYVGLDELDWAEMGYVRERVPPSVLFVEVTLTVVKLRTISTKRGN